MKCIIEDAGNGWIVTTKLGKQVFKYEDDDSKEQHEALQEMFYFIMDCLEVYNSKHNKTRLNIEVEEQE